MFTNITVIFVFILTINYNNIVYNSFSYLGHQNNFCLKHHTVLEFYYILGCKCVPKNTGTGKHSHLRIVKLRRRRRRRRSHFQKMRRRRRRRRSHYLKMRRRRRRRRLIKRGGFAEAEAEADIRYITRIIAYIYLK